MFDSLEYNNCIKGAGAERKVRRVGDYPPERTIQSRMKPAGRLIPKLFNTYDKVISRRQCKLDGAISSTNVKYVSDTFSLMELLDDGPPPASLRIPCP